MSRSGYSDDLSNWELIMYRGAVSSAIRGKRGQTLLRELAVALDAMEPKRLITDELQSHGEYCALGVVGKHRGINMQRIDPHDSDRVAKSFDISNALACEIASINDDWGMETPEKRWRRVRDWVGENLNKTLDGMRYA
jgi:hypothetical protein